MTDRAPRDEADLYRLGIDAQQAITGDRFGVGVACRQRPVGEPKGLAVAPGMLIRLGQTGPPDLIGKAQYPLRVRLGQANQSITLLFLAA